jgi:hypothetical protein
LNVAEPVAELTYEEIAALEEIVSTAFSDSI